MARPPRFLLHLLSWVPVEAGIYRVNRVVNPEGVAIHIPPHSKLVYRVLLEDRPFSFISPTGGAVGRWAMHCHIFFHAALGMITELVATQ